MNKFAKVDDQTRQAAMAEYAEGKLTTAEVAAKYGFYRRRLRSWFEKDGRLDEFKKISNKNIVSNAKQPKSKEVKQKLSGRNSINWKGKKFDIKRGVISGVLIPSPNHPKANSQGYVFEHRLVMQEKEGRVLRDDEVVHHIDVDPTNNDVDNLMLLSHSEHTLLHVYMQLALAALMEPDDLQELSHYLLEIIKKDGKRNKTSDKKGRKDAGTVAT